MFCADPKTERVAKSLINTVESDVEQYLTRIVVAQTDVDACTRLVAAECRLPAYITSLDNINTNI